MVRQGQHQLGAGDTGHAAGVAGHGSSVAAHPDNTPVERERPEDWGWHHEWRRSTPVIGWVMTISMVLLVFGNHQGMVETWWLLVIAAAMAALLIRDRIKRKNAWRA